MKSGLPSSWSGKISSSMSDDTLGRLIGRELEDRHRARHSSTNYLAWDPMAQLVADLPQTWNTVRAEILQFLHERESSADSE